MTYGRGTSLFIENGPAVQAEIARARAATSRAWKALDVERRLNLVERALDSAGCPPAAA